MEFVEIKQLKEETKQRKDGGGTYTLVWIQGTNGEVYKLFKNKQIEYAKLQEGMVVPIVTKMNGDFKNHSLPTVLDVALYLNKLRKEVLCKDTFNDQPTDQEENNPLPF